VLIPAANLKRIRSFLSLALALLSAQAAVAAQPQDVPAQYRKFFVHYVDRRSLSEKVLNLAGLTSGDVGRSFALIAGVDTYPNLPRQDRSLRPAAVDLQNLERYLRDFEYFDEIVVLRNEAVTDDNFKYFLQAYFPERLTKFPKSRFLFAYSGHGIQEGPRGYLLQSNATSFSDKANSISLEVLRTLYGEIVDSAYQSLALINACHSGAFEKRAFGRRKLLPRGPGAHVITAGGTRELAWHDERVGPGSLFFEKLFAGLEGPADNEPIQSQGPPGDGVITVPELWAYLSEEIQLETDQRQNPLASDLSSNGSSGSFFFLNRGREVRAGIAQPWDSKRPGVRSLGTISHPEPSPQELASKGDEAFKRGHFGEALSRFLEACNSGSAHSCWHAGDIYHTGPGGLTVDQTKAVEFDRKACDKGDARGCAALGFMYDKGQGGLAADSVTAVDLYRKACDAGDGRGCSNLGVSYAKGQGGLVADLVKAVEFYRKACDAGDGKDCSNLGMSYANGQGGLAADPVKAAELYRTACDAGEALSCTNLGFVYEKGRGGLAPDQDKAVDLYRKACDAGDALGCTNLGFAYGRGQGRLAVDQGKAVELYRKACDADDALGCSNLGVAYEVGQGRLAVDQVKAVELYRKACDADDPLGCSNLGSAYNGGKGGLTRDWDKAVKLFQKACNAGNAQGCTNLGNMYTWGKGVPRDTAKAAELYKTGCNLGEPTACKKLKN